MKSDQYRIKCDGLASQRVKPCTKCREHLHYFYFNTNKRKYLNLSNICKICQAEAVAKKKGFVENRQTIRQRYDLIVKQQKLESKGKRWCPDCDKELEIKEHFQHREGKWARFKDSCKDCANEKIEHDKVKRSLRGRAWRESNKIHRWAFRTLQSHSERGYDCALVNVEQLKELVGNGINKCEYLGTEIIVGHNLTLDIKDPTGLFEIGNLCLCDRSCNSSKQRMNHQEFQDYLEEHPNIKNELVLEAEKITKHYYAEQIPLAKLKEIVGES